jgi:RNA polymerase sigma-54 factor
VSGTEVAIGVAFALFASPMPSLHQTPQLAAAPGVSAHLQQSVGLLHMPNAAFAATISASLLDNPFLEADDAADEAGQPPPATVWGGPGSRTGGAGPEDADLDPFATLAAPVSLCEHLHAQLRLQRLGDREFLLSCLVAGALDEDGYLRVSLAESVAASSMPQPPGAGELEAALARVQALDPPGVGARDVLECLRLQLPAVPDPLERAACARLLDACGSATPFDPRRLSRVMGCGDAALQRLLSCLRRLDPHPGWRYGCDETRYVLPDVIAVRSRRAWRVVLNDAVIPRIRLNAVYAELYQRHKAPAGTELGVKLQDARWTVRNLHQRFATILDVAQAILRRQSPFLDHGPMAMRPLGLAEIAQELDMHESTVSRATHEKYIATPAGTFELKYFFSRAISAGTGHASSPTAIRALVGEIIAREHPAAPLSDVAVTRQLARRGIAIARRTVTKYRQQLGIPAADERGDAGVQAAGTSIAGLRHDTLFHESRPA